MENNQEKVYVGIWLQLRHKKLNKIINSWSHPALSFIYEIGSSSNEKVKKKIEDSIDRFYYSHCELLEHFDITKEELLNTITVKEWFSFVDYKTKHASGIDEYWFRIQEMKDKWNKQMELKEEYNAKK